jgi:hypothetical protein
LDVVMRHPTDVEAKAVSSLPAVAGSSDALIVAKLRSSPHVPALRCATSSIPTRPPGPEIADRAPDRDPT